VKNESATPDQIADRPDAFGQTTPHRGSPLADQLAIPRGVRSPDWKIKHPRAKGPEERCELPPSDAPEKRVAQIEFY